MCASLSLGCWDYKSSSKMPSSHQRQLGLFSVGNAPNSASSLQNSIPGIAATGSSLVFLPANALPFWSICCRRKFTIRWNIRHVAESYISFWACSDEYFKDDSSLERTLWIAIGLEHFFLLLSTSPRPFFGLPQISQVIVPCVVTGSVATPSAGMASRRAPMPFQINGCHRKTRTLLTAFFYPAIKKMVGRNSIDACKIRGEALSMHIKRDTFGRVSQN